LPTFAPAVNWPWRAQAPAGPISLHQPPSRRRHRRGISIRQKLFEDPLRKKISRWRRIYVEQDAASDKVAAWQVNASPMQGQQRADASQDRRWEDSRAKTAVSVWATLRRSSCQCAVPTGGLQRTLWPQAPSDNISLIYEEHRSIRAYAGFALGLPLGTRFPAPDRILLPASYLSNAVLRPPAATTHSDGLAPLPERTEHGPAWPNSSAPLTSAEANLA
jgi:hypothetical protein